MSKISKIELNFPVSEKLDMVNTLADSLKCAVSSSVNVKVKCINQISTTVKKYINGKAVDMAEFLVGDESGTSKLTAWGADITNLTAGKSYRLENLSVRQFNDIRHLNTTTTTVVMEINEEVPILEGASESVEAEKPSITGKNCRSQ